jgi:predicted molibdopterin-dependent oxidoreductase YjgC
MEKPNKWNGRADDWTSAVCNSCSVGCTLTYGTSDQVGSENGPVIVRPERINPFSRDQICVRGRFGYDAIDSSKRLEKSMVRTEGHLLPVGDSEAIATAVTQIQDSLSQHGPDSIAMLGSPLTTTEEAMCFSNIADALGVKNIDFSLGTTHRAVLTAFDDTFGTAVIPTELTDIEESKTIICIATDLEESHQAVSLRIKGMVRNADSDLVLISPKWSELDSFAKAVIRCLPGEEAYVADQLAKRLGEAPDPIDQDTWDKAIALMSDTNEETRSIVVFAPNAVDQEYAGELAKSAGNLAISLAPERAHECVMYLPPDGNTNGIHDAGVHPRDGGLSFSEMIPAIFSGDIKCLIVHDDNPLVNGLGTDDLDPAFRNLDSLIVIDSVQSSLLEYASVAISQAAFYHRSGSITTADRRVLFNNSIDSVVDSQKSGLAIFRQIAERLDMNVDASPSLESLSNYPSRAEVATSRGTARAVGTGVTYKALPAEVRVPTASSAEGLKLFTSRSLYTSWEGTSTASEEADKLDRDGVAWINPSDAAHAGIKIGDSVAIRSNGHELSAPVRLDDGVNPGTVYVPSYFKSAKVMSFFRYGPSQDAPVIELSAE